MPPSPFLIGTPLPPERFVGRADALRVVRGRLANGESTAVVGGPHIGKTSLLRFVARELRESGGPEVCVEVDCHLLASSYRPADFWDLVVDEVAQAAAAAGLDSVLAQAGRARESGYGSFTLERLFRLLARAGRRAALLVDEFDALLAHENFNTAEFFGALRSLSSRTDGLALVTASRLGVAEMNQHSRQLTGSPFFNTFREVALTPLAPDEALAFAEAAAAIDGRPLTDDDRAYLLAASALHPFLLQAAGAALLEARAAGLPAPGRYLAADEALARLAAPHYDDAWRALPDRQRRALRRLSLAGAHAAELSWPAADRPALRRLADQALIAPADQPERWRIAPPSLSAWLAELEPERDSALRGPPAPLSLSLRLTPQQPATQIIWESEALGRRDSAFRPPYDQRALPLVLRALDALQHPGHPLEGPQLAPADQAALRALGLWDSGRVPADAPRRVGRALLGALTADPQAAAALRDARGQAAAQGRPLGLDLRFPASAAQLVALPWELLWDDAGPLLLGRGRPASCVRYLDLPEAPPPPRPPGRPLRILAVVPHADMDDETLHAEREARRAAWAALVASGAAAVDELSPATPRMLAERIQDGPPVDVLHFFGHGRYRAGQGELLLDRPGGGRAVRRADQIAGLLAAARLVVLHACQSATVGTAGASGDGSLLTGVAPALCAAGAHAVLAMQMSVRVAAAVRFSERTYAALARGESLQEAVARARQALAAEEDDDASWYVPTLTVRSLGAEPLVLLPA